MKTRLGIQNQIEHTTFLKHLHFISESIAFYKSRGNFSIKIFGFHTNFKKFK